MTSRWLLCISCFLSTILAAVSSDQIKGRIRGCPISEELPIYRYVGPCEDIPEGDDEFDSLNVPSFCRRGLRGQPGEPGEIGRAGYPGANGMMGPAGAPGVPGADGLVGPKGPQGPQGPAGSVGPQGPTGPQGITGATGADGLQGPVGEQGPQGPQGPAGPSSDPVPGQVQEYLNVYNTAIDTVDNNQATPFNTNGIVTNGFFHDTSSVDNSRIFVALNPGTYKITFLFLTTGSAGAVAVVVNDILLLENTYFIKAANQQIQGFLIEEFAIGDHFSIVHVNDTNAFTLGSPINASVMIEKLG